MADGKPELAYGECNLASDRHELDRREDKLPLNCLRWPLERLKAVRPLNPESLRVKVSLPKEKVGL